MLDEWIEHPDYNDYTPEAGCWETDYVNLKDDCGRYLQLILLNLYSKHGTIESIEYHLEDLASRLMVPYPEGKIQFIKMGPVGAEPEQNRVA